MIKIKFEDKTVEIDEDEKVCHNCKYCHIIDNWNWFCRKYAPSKTGLRDVDVTYDYWCGEFQTKYKKDLCFGPMVPTLIGKAAEDFIEKANNVKPIEITEQQRKIHEALKKQ